MTSQSSFAMCLQTVLSQECFREQILPRVGTEQEEMFQMTRDDWNQRRLPRHCDSISQLRCQEIGNSGLFSNKYLPE